MPGVRMSVERWWGRADFEGRPSSRLLLRGTAAGALGAGCVAGAGAAGLLSGHRELGAWAGTAVTLGLALYLFTAKAGHAWVLGVVALGVGLSWLGPRAGAEAVLVARGEVRMVEVTEVREYHHTGRNYIRYECSVAQLDGAPVDVVVAASCDEFSAPGHSLRMVFDPSGAVDPTDRPLPSTLLDALAPLGVLTSAFAGVCCVAIVCSRPWTPRTEGAAPARSHIPDPDAWARHQRRQDRTDSDND